MFIRFSGTYSSPFTKQPYGIFTVIYHLKRDGILSPADSDTYDRTNDWFERHLPNPPYYKEHNNSFRAVTWFKDDPHTIPMVAGLKPFFEIAEKYGVEIRKSVSEQPPGTIVYEDDYQIGVISGAIK